MAVEVMEVETMEVVVEVMVVETATIVVVAVMAVETMVVAVAVMVVEIMEVEEVVVVMVVEAAVLVVEIVVGTVVAVQITVLLVAGITMLVVVLVVTVASQVADMVGAQEHHQLTVVIKNSLAGIKLEELVEMKVLGKTLWEEATTGMIMMVNLMTMPTLRGAESEKGFSFPLEHRSSLSKYE